MNYLARRLACTAALIGLTACMPGSSGSDSASSQGETATETTDGAGIWIEFADGCIVDPYAAIQPEGEMTMVRGGQGLLMFPLHIRAGGFDHDEDLGPGDPRVPQLDLQVRVDGYNNGPGGTFARIANYPVLFSNIEGGSKTHEFRYLTVFVPDDVSGSGENDSPDVVDGLTAQVTYTFEVDGEAPVVGAFNALLRVPQPFEPEASCGF